MRRDSHMVRRRPLYETVLNRFGAICPSAYVAQANRPVDALLAAAVRHCGHDDFGDANFLNALGVLLNALRGHGELTYTGWLRIHALILAHLRNRLHIEHALKRQPAILREEIRSPVFVLGLPRTGTTLMHRLLACDPDNRTLSFWEGSCPAPPATPKTREADRRIIRAQRLIRAIRRAIPDYDSVHPLDARAPEECRMLFMNTFLSSGFRLFAPVPTYHQWLARQDMTEAYRHYRRQLQMLQFGCRRERWALKSPPHARHLEELMTVFPDATVICMHRDPLKAIPSAASLVARWRNVFNASVDLSRLGEELHDYGRDTVQRLMSSRRKLGSAPFCDVQYADLIRDPLGTVAAVYARFGLAFSISVRDAMHAWLDRNARHTHGTHGYSLDPYGLDRDRIMRNFAEYRRRFSVPAET